jgi:hypothetical protein
MRAKMPPCRGRCCRCNAGNNNNSTMLAMTPAGCRQNASAMLANAIAALAGPLKANSATMPAQRRQQGQLDAGNMPVQCKQGHQHNTEKTPLLTRPDHQRPNCCGPMSGTAMRPQVTMMSATTTPHRQRVATASRLFRCQFMMLAATRV